MTGFDADTLRLLADEAEVDIETRRRDGSTRRTTIWIMVDGDEVFVRSVRGPDGAWYRAIMRDGEARVHAGDRALAVRATPAADAATIERVSAATTRKYEQRWPGPTAAMLRPETLGTTLRLEPA